MMDYSCLNLNPCPTTTTQAAGVMDYSLLLGVHFVNRKRLDDDR